MVSRKEKIKDKRAEELKEQQQVRIAVAVIGVIMIIGVAIFVAYQNGAFVSAYDPSKTGNTGSPDEICAQNVPFTAGTGTQYTAAPEQMISASIDYAAIFCTDIGAVYIDLYEDRTPVTINSFVFLATNNFYNGTIFHRVIEGFMAQGGDPTGTGAGGPGYKFIDEVFPDLGFDRPYLLAMANAGAGTNGSQFFITFAPTPHLNMAHTIFGEVISGQQVVDSITRRDPNASNSPATLLAGVVIVTPSQVTIGQ